MAFVGKRCKRGPTTLAEFPCLDTVTFRLINDRRWSVELVPRSSLSFHCANYTKTRTYNPRKTERKERRKDGRKDLGGFNVSTLAFISSKRGRLPAATYNTVIVHQWDFSSSIVLVDTDASYSTHATDVPVYDP